MNISRKFGVSSCVCVKTAHYCQNVGVSSDDQTLWQNKSRPKTVNLEVN